jgi:Rrf2 family protein
MAHLTVSVEYGIHSLLWMVDSDGSPVSTRDLAEFQGISPSFVAKIFPRLEKAGILRASEGVRGGYLLARPPEDISFLQIVDAIEGQKPLFDCQDIRGRCAIFQNRPPGWATAGVCSVHAVMLRAEKAMRDTLAAQSLADLAQAVGRKAPPDFSNEARDWLGKRAEARGRKPAAPSPREARPREGGRG